MIGTVKTTLSVLLMNAQAQVCDIKINIFFNKSPVYERI